MIVFYALSIYLIYQILSNDFKQIILDLDSKMILLYTALQFFVTILIYVSFIVYKNTEKLNLNKILIEIKNNIDILQYRIFQYISPFKFNLIINLYKRKNKKNFIKLYFKFQIINQIYGLFFILCILSSINLIELHYIIICVLLILFLGAYYSGFLIFIAYLISFISIDLYFQYNAAVESDLIKYVFVIFQFSNIISIIVPIFPNGVIVRELIFYWSIIFFEIADSFPSTEIFFFMIFLRFVQIFIDLVLNIYISILKNFKFKKLSK